MAEQQPKRKGKARSSLSRSPSPVIKPAYKQVPSLLEEVDLGPMGMSWPLYRWVVRVLMVLCLYQCAVVYVLCHDLAYQSAETQLAEELTVGFLIIVCMSKMWHRKRMPGYLLWIFLVLLIYLWICAVGARKIYEYDLKLQEEERQKEHRQQAEMMRQIDYLKRMGQQIQLEHQQIKQEQLTVEGEDETVMKTVGNIAWNILELYLKKQ